MVADSLLKLVKNRFDNTGYDVWSKVTLCLVIVKEG